MSHPTRAKAFGEGPIGIQHIEPIRISTDEVTIVRDQAPTALWRILDRMLLWIPREATPGLQALCLVALRMFFIPFAIALPLIALGTAATGSPILAWITAPLWILRLTSSSLVHELCRYSFVRRANSPLRAASIFACACLLAELIGSRSVMTGGTDVLIELIASAAILLALNHKRHVPIVIAALVAIGATGNAILSKYVILRHSDPVSQEEPTVGNMPTWAKLYPGSTITVNRPQKILSMTQWEVIYDTKASPDKIDFFYSETLGREGFTLETDVFGIKTFINKANGNRISYSAKGIIHGSQVFFLARYYGH